VGSAPRLTAAAVCPSRSRATFGWTASFGDIVDGDDATAKDETDE